MKKSTLYPDTMSTLATMASFFFFITNNATDAIWVAVMAVLIFVRGESRMNCPENAPDYTSFFSSKAVEFVKWSCTEKDRIKARKIYESACKIEYQYRKRQTGNTSPDVHVWSGGCYTHANSLLMICASERWRASIKKGG